MSRPPLPLLRFLSVSVLLWVVPAVGGAERIRVTVAAAGGEEAIHAALGRLPLSGGVVELGAGTFSISRPIFLDRDGVELRGQGPATRLQLVAHANCPVVVIGHASTPPERLVRHVTVRALVIDGYRAMQHYECWGGHCDERGRTALRNNGITIRGAEDILVEDVVTHGARSGGVVLEKHCRRVRINRLESYDNEFDGLAAYETEDSEFTKLSLHHNRSAGLSLDWRFNRNRITDSSASDNGSQGIFMRDSNANVFERMTLANNGEQGVFVAETRELPGTACRDNTFRAVTVTGNRTQGIRINDASCTPNLIEDSLVEGNRLENISLAAVGQLAVVRARGE